jgi:hypothetical protein
LSSPEFPPDLIAEVLAGRVSSEDADAAFDRLISAVHAGEIDPTWWPVIGLSEDEATMVLEGRSFPDIADARRSRSDRMAMTESLSRWLSTVDGPSVFLPWGWYGRPYDNAHQLTASLFSPDQIALQFDHILLLVATGYGSIEVDSPSGRPGSPAADEEWTTITVEGIGLLAFISSDTDLANDATVQSARDAFFTLVAPRPEPPLG